MNKIIKNVINLLKLLIGVFLIFLGLSAVFAHVLLNVIAVIIGIYVFLDGSSHIDDKSKDDDYNDENNHM